MYSYKSRITETKQTCRNFEIFNSYLSLETVTRWNSLLKEMEKDDFKNNSISLSFWNLYWYCSRFILFKISFLSTSYKGLEIGIKQNLTKKKEKKESSNKWLNFNSTFPLVPLIQRLAVKLPRFFSMFTGDKPERFWEK